MKVISMMKGRPVTPLMECNGFCGTEPKHCIDCGTEMTLDHEMDTDRRGNLKYYYCKSCKERFVSQDGGELAIPPLKKSTL